MGTPDRVGLGLALVQTLVEVHGRMAVESEPGKGSTFTVRPPYRRHKWSARSQCL